MSRLTDLLDAIAEAVIAEADALNRLDGVAGDGDLGVTMTTAANALKALRDEIEPLDPASALRRCGSELARKAPSTSGTLVATAFLRAARVAGEPAADEVAALTRALEAAQQGIEERGKAAPGDKTMLDALAPAVAALREAGGQPLPAALARAAAAAEAGAAATRGMRAKVGRAGWLAERSEGSEDAGAHLVSTVFAAAARAVG
jgi:dihydroxyacetone kinase